MKGRSLLAVAGASAVAASSHEVVWSRLLARWVGNTAWAVGVTLGVFMLGMGVGALLPGLRPRLLARARRNYALAELVVALGGVASLALFARVPPPSSMMGGTSLALDVVAGSLVLLVPALAMGATWPLLVSVASRATDDARAPTGLYIAGLVGAVGGVLLAAGVVAPRVGFDALAVVASAINVGVAVAAGVSPSPPRPPSPVPGAGGADPLVISAPAPPAPGTGEGGRGGEGEHGEIKEAALTFGCAGLFGMGAQALWNRVLVPYAGVSSFAFAAIVAVYVGAQALGGLFARRQGDDRAQTWSWRGMALAPAVCVLSLGANGVVATWVPAREGSALAWSLATLAAVAVVAGPTAWLLGVAQTATLRAVEARRDAWGTSAARVVGVGTVLSAAGSLLGSLVLFPRVGPRVGLAILALPALAQVARTGASRVALTGAIALGVAVALRPGPAHFLGNEWDAAPVLAADFGVQDTTGVVLHDQPVEPRIRRLVANGVSYSGDSLFAQRYMRLLAHLPALAARENRRALVVCIGTGTTASALRAYPFASIDAVDISPAVRDMLAWFEHVHARMLDDPRVHVITDDGDHFLRATRERYDVITLEPPPPRAPGGSSLYAEDFYRAAASRLSAGGVVAQWLPLHDMTAWEARVIVATFVRVFPRATLHLAERNEAILLSDRGRLASPAARLQRAEVQRDLAHVGIPAGDPLRETLLATLDGAPREPVIRHAWPAPELTPLSLPSPVEALSTWMESTLARADPAPDTFAATVGPAVPAFLRVLERDERPGDRPEVTRALGRMLARHPDNDYWQHVHGFGRYLEERLTRARADGLPAEQESRVRARIEALRRRQGLTAE